MGFTRSDTNIKVHQSMSDYPNADDGMTAEDLKKTFDKPAETLQNDLNKLMTELESTSAGANIGVEALNENDESANTLIAKLRYIYNALVDAILGQVPDNSITQAKLNSEYDATLAKRNSLIQTNLNAEKVGGKTIQNIMADTMNLKTIVDYKSNQDTSVATINNIQFENNKTYLLLVGVPKDNNYATSRNFSLSIDDLSIVTDYRDNFYGFLFITICCDENRNENTIHIAGNVGTNNVFKDNRGFDISVAHSFTLAGSADYLSDVIHKGSYLKLFELIGGTV